MMEADQTGRASTLADPSPSMASEQPRVLYEGPDVNQQPPDR